MKEKIIFFGSGPYVIPVIEELNKNFDLVLVATTEEENRGRVFSYCRENNIEAYTISSFSEDEVNTLLDCRVRVAVLASFGLIIPDKVLNMFEFGIINIHPSLLPKYRGPTPVQSAILSGDKKTGVSIIKLDSEVDHGPILAQEEIEIEESDTADSLYKKLFKQGAEIIAKTLPDYLSKNLTLQKQNHADATFTEHLTRESGFIDFNSPPETEKIKRIIKAYFPWPGVWFKTELDGKTKIIKLLPENKIQVEGKNIMTIKDFRNGYAEGKLILEKLGLNNE